ncbi:MAG: peptidoglycan-binding protein LysM [Lysobacteraceae bacterium]|nr:MAG: peptidoglycan-binding protein LysM [Xanthomonadaceae bacterium]
MKAVRHALLLILLVGLAACAPQRTVRVQPERPQTRPVPAGLYEVVRGDTLYGIAFRHGLDYRELAALNGIRPPYTIYPGQRLRLGPASPQGSPPARAGAQGASVLAQAGGGTGSDRAPSTPAPRAGQAGRPPAAPAGASAAGPAGAAARPSVSAPEGNATANGPLRWQWPAEGALVGRFVAGDPTRQGIAIAGRSGDPVRAAADGVVVYSGSGLIGYGELVIVKHDDTWLSAYGHNRKRLVAEGERVRAGQPIAEMGRTGATRDMLHFEIRRNGKPVDPLGLLPRR